MKKIILIVALFLSPILMVGLYSAITDDPPTNVPKPKEGPVSVVDDEVGEQPQAFLDLPGTAGSIDEQGKLQVGKQPKYPEPPKVEGVVVTGGDNWSERSAAARNAIQFSKDLASVNIKKPEELRPKMQPYASESVIETAIGLVDPSATANGRQRHRPVLQNFFMFEDPQSGAHMGKLLYKDQTYLTMEFAPGTGKIIVLHIG